MVRTLFRLFLIVIVLVFLAAIYALWPRQGDLRTFEPEVIARLETDMWRAYYDHNYQSLAGSLYSLYHDVYHFSPADAAQLAFDSGKAAQLFQPTTSRDEAQVALPWLIKYYDLLRSRSGETFDPEKAAGLELEWWQLRREKAAPAVYGKVVAQVAEELFKVTNEHIDKSAQLRAEMMRYRDDRRGRMQPEDWDHIEQNLVESYRELKTGVARTP
jgi:hypothetical protein